MRRLTWMVICFVTLTLTLASIAAADPATVGELGDPDRIQFAGNESFDSQQLRSALGFNMDILLAGHPDTPRDELLSLLEHKVRDGYRHLGFAEATVTARFDATRPAIVVTIDEGARSVCGQIEITGATTIPVERLKTRLTSPRVEQTQPPKSHPALWRVGKPASFADGHWLSQRGEFKKVFHTLGYFDARFAVSTRPESDGTATLVVDIQDEGPRAVLGEIEVVGAQKNSADDVIRYLDLPAGTVLDSETKSKIEQKLSDAARFLKHEVEIITPPFGNGASILRVRLVEYPKAPALSEDFSKDEEVFVRMARWVNSIESTDDDFSIHLTGPADTKLDAEKELPPGALVAHLRLAISHREQACLFHARIVEHPNREVFSIWIHLTPKSSTIDSPRQALRYEASGIRQSVIGSATMSPHPPDAQGHRVNFQFGIGMKVEPGQMLPPLMLQVKAAPVATLIQVHKLQDPLQLQDGVLTLDKPNQHLAIESATGRLMKFDFEVGPQCRLAAAFEPGLYRTLLAEYQQQTAGARVIPAGDAPISNLLSFLATCIPERKPGAGTRSSEALASLAHSLLKRGTFRAFDDLLLTFLNRPEDVFSIPPESNPKKPQPDVGWMAYMLPVARMIVPNPSWTWTISREFVFAQSRRSPRSGEAINALLADRETGPVANLTSAWVFGMLHPPLKAEFARRGLTRLQRAHFQSDYEPFLRDDSPIGKVLLATAQTLQEVDDHEIQSLVDQLPLNERDRRSLARALRLFPEHKSRPAIDALRSAFDEAWEPLIQPRVRALLEIWAN